VAERRRNAPNSAGVPGDASGGWLGDSGTQELQDAATLFGGGERRVAPRVPDSQRQSAGADRLGELGRGRRVGVVSEGAEQCLTFGDVVWDPESGTVRGGGDSGTE